MYQETSPRSRQSKELAGYGDLSDFDPQTSRRSKEQEENDLIDSIMGGEDFCVGDGTLEFNLREEDRDLIAREPVRATAPIAHTPESESQEEDFAPIEAGHPDPGDEVARKLVHEALFRLQDLAGDSASVEEAPHGEVETISELSEEGTEDLLSSTGGMGSDLESDAPSPFALHKLPGSFAPYAPPASEARLTSREIDQEAEVEERSAEPDLQIAMPRFVDGPVTSKADPIPSTIESTTDDFAPFEQRVEAEAAMFNSRQASVPSYAKTREQERSMSSASSAAIDEFLPPSASNEPTTAEHSRDFVREVPPAPTYSQPRQTLEEPEPFGFEQYARGQSEEEGHEEEAREPVAEEPYQEESAEEIVAAAPVRKSFIQQNWMVVVAATVIAGLVGYKQFMMKPADESLAAPKETVEASQSQQPIDAAVTELVEQPAETPFDLPVAVAEPTIEAPLPVAATPTINPALEAKLTELATRMSALESERDRLRAENESLKKKPVATPKNTTKPAQKPAEPKLEATKLADEIPARKPLPNIQYLGTFSDGDRLVAEVIIDGSLLRIKRGDVLIGDRRVTAVGDMSVTIDEAVYSP
jgi:hypothetical protein